MTKKILVAADGSPASDRAVAFAANCAAADNAELLIVTISDGLVSESLRSMARAERATVQQMLDLEATAILAEARRIASQCGLVHAKTRSENGDPAAVILDVALAEGVDFIVVGKRGRGRLEGLLLGSVSQKIASLAPCAVAIIP